MKNLHFIPNFITNSKENTCITAGNMIDFRGKNEDRRIERFTKV